MRCESLVCAVIVFAACVKRETGDGSGASTSDDESGQVDADLPSEEPVPYGPCNQACRSGDLCSECSGFGCAEPNHSGILSVCIAPCESAADCPEPPIQGDTVCISGACYVNCDAGPCPEGQTCVHFLNLADPRVCMYLEDSD